MYCPTCKEKGSWFEMWGSWEQDWFPCKDCNGTGKK